MATRDNPFAGRGGQPSAGADAGAGHWRLTPLGKALAVVLAAICMVGGLLLSRQAPARPAAPVASLRGLQAQAHPRVFTTSDAVDFTQLTYQGYLKDIAAETAPKSAGPPYDTDLMLGRLQRLQPAMSPSLYGKLQALYTQSASVGTISRDEVLCGRPDATRVAASLKLGGQDTAVVTVTTYAGDRQTGSLDVTVDLHARVLAEIACGQ